MRAAIFSPKTRIRVRRLAIAAMLMLGGAAAVAWSSTESGPGWINVREVVLAHSDAVNGDAYTPSAGSAEADVTITEFFDYNCRHCRRMAPAMHQVLAEDGRLRVLYRDIPYLRPSSLFAAKAALAARMQGKYVEVHRALMAISGEADEETVMRVAGDSGVDLDRLRADMEGTAVATALDRNFRFAKILKIDATPAILVGEKLVLGAMEPEAIQSLIIQARRAR